MGTEKVKLTLTVDESIVAIIKGADHGASSWIETAVEYHLRRGQDALRRLTEVGWQGNELLAIANACMGWYRVGAENGPSLALEMHDFSRLEGPSWEQWEVGADRWAELVARVAEAGHQEIGDLFTIVDEVWLGLGDVDRRLRRDQP